ncbi:MAG: fructose-1,6-bisphosphatase [Bacteroidota bacterium]
MQNLGKQKNYPMVEDKKFLDLLASKYPNRAATAKEIVLLSSVLHLTKGTEIFLSDIHGEDEAFDHVLRNGSGVIKQKIKELFPDLAEAECNQLATLIYYPEEKLALLKQETTSLATFYQTVLHQLIRLTRSFASIYSSNKFKKLLHKSSERIISELVAERELGEANNYYDHLIDSIIEIGQADQLIVEFSELIQRLSIHRVHIIGDVFDRGPGAHNVMDALSRLHSLDIQWGNHDVVWMGAALGSEACMANVLRLSLRYANTDTLEKGYSIQLLPLASFALEHYKDDESMVFDPKVPPSQLFNESEHWLSGLMHKAITIIQFKLEGQLIQRRPSFKMEDRLLLDKIDFEKGTVHIAGTDYPMRDTFFPTIDPKNPYALSPEEEALVACIRTAFLKSEKLQQHVQLLFEKGSMYLVSNHNLLYHGCIPLQQDGTFRAVDLGGGPKKGKALMDYLNKQLQIAQSGNPQSAECSYARDLVWYLWAGPDSPLFGKSKMATFERYFLTDKAIQKEEKDSYYHYRDNPATCAMILEEFGLSANDSVILNGHVPVSVKKGENPVKADGKLIVIDGGFSKAYQGQTGIAGYTLIHNCFGRQLIAHEPFETRAKAIAEEQDIAYSKTILNQSPTKLKVRDLDDGKRVQERIADLKLLLAAYEGGWLREGR